MNKFSLICGIIFFLFSCQNNPIEKTKENPPSQATNSGTTILTGEILPPNEKSTQAEKEFANDLNNLLNTIETESDEWTNNTKN